jgi:hypothetical protein
MNERIWDKFLTERDKAVFAAGVWSARGVRQATGVACDRCQLGVLREASGTYP